MFNKKNKILIIIIITLMPITIISFSKKETNFIMKENKHHVDKTINVNIISNNYNISVPLEEYIIGVVAGEMPALFEEEALKAQAIASRTYVIKHLQNNNSISNTINDQVYLTKDEMKEKWQNNFEKYYTKISACVSSTKSLIMYYNNQPIKAYYYAMSNGYTESSLNVFNEENPYLQIISSPYDEDNENTVTISKKEFCQKLQINCSSIIITDINKDKSNRVSTIKINNQQFTGLDIRKKLSLRSTDFTIEVQNAYLKITTKGYGHGVGMSQYGANNMAKEGYKYDEILKYYYQNIEIASI